MANRFPKNAACIVALLASVTSCCLGQTADAAASPQTRQILQYLKGLSSGPERRLISGHQLNTQFSPAASFDSAASKIYGQTGQWVGLIGIDYQRQTKGPLRSMSQTNKPIIDYFHSGGLVAIMTSFTNPWTDSTMNDTTGRLKLAELVVQGTPGNAKWIQRLDSVAAGFRQLQDSGVTILYRPLHEMNGAWFWWGSQSPTLPLKQDYAALWRHLFNYFTVTKGLHNILWVFSPSARPSSATNPVFKHDTTFYPGSDFVDIVGVDVYEDTLDIPSHASLRSYGKPLALCEFGPGASSSAAPGRYDYRILLQQVKSKYPEFVYWMSWNDFGSSLGSKYFGMTSQNHVSDLLLDAWVINRDKIQWRGVTYVRAKQSMIPPSVFLHQNCPNPFNPSTTISFTIPQSQHVSLVVYDVLGRAVATLVDSELGAGSHSVSVDGQNLASGMYIYRIRSGDFVQEKKMQLVK